MAPITTSAVGRSGCAALGQADGGVGDFHLVTASRQEGESLAPAGVVVKGSAALGEEVGGALGELVVALAARRGLGDRASDPLLDQGLADPAGPQPKSSRLSWAKSAA